MKEKVYNHIFCLIVILLLVFIIIFLSVMLLSTKKYVNPYQVEFGPADNFVFLGDSITDFYPLDEYYENIPVVNSGISGNKTTDILGQLDARVYQYNPTKVILLIGTNDLAEDSDLAEKQVLENIKKIVSSIRKNRSCAQIYIQSIYPVNKSVNASMVGNRNPDRIKRINKKLNSYCKKEKLTFINMYEHLVDENNNLKEKYTEDGLHLNSLGYVVVTREILPFLND